MAVVKEAVVKEAVVRDLRSAERMSVTLYDSLRVLVLGGHARAVSVNAYRVGGTWIALSAPIPAVVLDERRDLDESGARAVYRATAVLASGLPSTAQGISADASGYDIASRETIGGSLALTIERVEEYGAL